MRFALVDQKLTPVWAQASRGVCPFCSENVMPVRSIEKVHHWRHWPSSDCPQAKVRAGSLSWQETAWHLGWKTRFAPELCEQPRADGLIPDVTLPGGRELEFQVKALSLPEVIQRRFPRRNPVLVIPALFRSWESRSGRMHYYDVGNQMSSMAMEPGARIYATRVKIGRDPETQGCLVETWMPSAAWVHVAPFAEIWLDAVESPDLIRVDTCSLMASEADRQRRGIHWGTPRALGMSFPVDVAMQMWAEA